jgi:hypothetical protein
MIVATTAAMDNWKICAPGAFIRLMRQSVSVKHREQRYHRQEDEDFGADLV